MDRIIITGGIPLYGKVEISGAKNSALPLMCASLLTDQTLALSNLPHLADIATMASLLINHGVDFMVDGRAEFGGHTGRVLNLNAADITSFTAPYDIVRKMRASILVLGPLLSRFGHAKVSLPGGCAIGTRPVDMHLAALEKMGALIMIEDGYIIAEAKQGLRGAEIEFDKISVGATENILMAAALAHGTTVIKNAALEPEIGDLANCLVKMGADISGIDTPTLVIKGVAKLGGANYAVIPDRIEAGTYAAAAAITAGELELVNIRPDIMQATIDILQQAGAQITPTANGMIVKGSKKIAPVTVETAPYPQFATDMQAQILALMTLAEGTSRITETIFENRFMHAPELARMGAKIKIEGHTSIITGVKKLTAASVMATDLRASVSLVIAALAAAGDTTINRVYHLDRGYELIEEKLSAVGARIIRIR